MKTLITILALTATMIGCAPDDQEFDISSLSSRHQKITIELMGRLNLKMPNAILVSSPDGISTASYGTPTPGAPATTHHPIPFVKGWDIIFSPHVLYYPDNILLRITTHEFCHVLGIDHNNGNPQGGNCLEPTE